MTYMEMYAGMYVKEFEAFKKYNDAAHKKMVDIRLAMLAEGEFTCYCRYTGMITDPGPYPRRITTGEVLEALCKIGATEYVAYILQYLHERGIKLDTEEKL